jgi:PAS domain S-box-containing protein
MEPAGIDVKPDPLSGEQSIDASVLPSEQPPRLGKGRQRTIRFRLTCLVLACMLPVCITAGFVLYYSYQYRRMLLEKRVLETTRALSMVVDQQLATMQASAMALATSPSLASGNLKAFYTQAQTLLQNYPAYDVVLFDANGRSFLNTRVPFGTPMPTRRFRDVMQKVFETGKPGITNLYKGERTGRYLFGIEVPVFKDGRVMYDILIAVHADDFAKVLSQQRIPSEWPAAILDANDVLVTQTRFPERYVGRLATPALVKRMAEAVEGSVETPDQEGTNVLSTFHRSTMSGWSVAIGVPETVILADVWRWLIWLIGGIVLLSAAAIALAIFLARRMAGSIQALVAPSLALGSGERVEIGQLDLKETNEVGQSLVKASQLLQRRNAEAKLHATELSAVVQVLRESQEKLSLVMEAADLGTWDWDIAADHLVWSPRCLAVFGLEPDTPMSYQRFLDALHPDDRERIDKAVRTALERHTDYNVEMRTVWPDGSLHWVSSRGRAYYDSSGRAVRMNGAAHDITQHKLADEALFRSEKLNAIGRMAATIAHEINNPLEAVTNSLFLAETVENLPELARHYLETADHELRRVAHITRQSLGFYRESNVPVPTSVTGMLESSVELLKSKIRVKHAIIEKQWDGDVQVVAVAGELRQVFSNLLVNSLDAIDEKGIIKLRVSNGSASNGHRCVRVTVADNGKGIGAATLPHIFEPLFTTKQSTGSGLGLWVCKQIIEKHQGSIQVRSRTNGKHRGTMFSIVIPVEQASHASAAAAS